MALGAVCLAFEAGTRKKVSPRSPAPHPQLEHQNTQLHKNSSGHGIPSTERRPPPGQQSDSDAGTKQHIKAMGQGQVGL